MESRQPLQGYNMKGLNDKDHDNNTVGMSDEKDVELPGKKPSQADRMSIVAKELPDYIDLNGIKYIFWDKSSMTRRLIWAVIVILCIGFVFFELITQVALYLSYPVSVTVNISHVSELPFPRVTICNDNQIRKSALPGNPQSAGGEDIDLETVKEDGTNWEEFYTDKAHKKDDMIKECIWEGEKCTHNNFTKMFTDLGVCYVFNGEGGQRNVTLDGPSQITTRHAHQNYGLTLLMHVQTEEYIRFRSRVTGFKILVDEPGNPAHVRTRGIYVPVGGVVDVSLQREKLQNLQKPYENCGSRELKFYKKYSLQACREEADTMFVVDKCKCRLLYMRNDSIPVCSPHEEINCAEPALRNPARFSDFYCPVPCKEIFYETGVSHAQFSEIYLNGLVTKYGHDLDYWKRNAVEVNIFYRDLVEEIVTHTIAYTFLSMLSDIGGFIGLMLGGSLLVIPEIIDFCIVKLYRKWK